MKVLLSLVLVAMMGVSTQVMAAPADDCIQMTKPTKIKSAPQVKRMQRNDRVRLNKLVVTEINKFSERQDTIREQRNDRVTIVAELYS